MLALTRPPLVRFTACGSRSREDAADNRLLRVLGRIGPVFSPPTSPLGQEAENRRRPRRSARGRRPFAGARVHRRRRPGVPDLDQTVGRDGAVGNGEGLPGVAGPRLMSHPLCEL